MPDPVGFRRFLAQAALICGVGAALATVPGTAVSAGASPQAQPALRRGLAALARGDARTARVELMNAARADPRSVAVRVAQARALLALDQAGAAQTELDRAVRLGARPGALRPWLAWAALQQGDAAGALKQATATDADRADALILARMEGRAQQALGHPDAAARAFARARRMAPGDAPLWIDLARFAYANGDQAGAIGASAEAVRLAPKSAEALTLRALMVREQYGLAPSAPWFDAALRQDPNHVPALTEYAATLLDMGRASQALALTRRALALSPGLPRAYFLQAVLAARAGDYELARSMLDRTHGALDGQAATRLLRGVLQIQAGNGTLAVEQLAPLLAAQPLNVRARLLLARACYDAGQYGDAERTLFPLVERADAGTYALTLAARIHEALGHRTAAALFLDRAATPGLGRADVFRGAGAPGAVAAAAESAPGAAAPNLRLMRALWQAGQGDAALARARRLAAINPGAPDAWIALGDSLMLSGREGQAVDAFARANDLRFDRNGALRLIDAQQRAGQAAAARRTLGLFLASYPMDVDGLRLAAAAYLAAGEPARALAVLDGLRQRLGNEDVLLMADTARAYGALGRAEAALPFAAHAYRLQPAGAVAADSLGWTLFSVEGPRGESRDLLEKAAVLAPGAPLVRLHLGQLYAALGLTDKARAALQAAARAPDFPQRDEAMQALRAL